jgi:hypothetical protein
MGLRTRCRRCGRNYDLDRDAIVSDRGRLCPACRDVLPTGRADGAPDPFAPHTGAVSGEDQKEAGMPAKGSFPAPRDAPATTIEFAETFHKTPALVLQPWLYS